MARVLSRTLVSHTAATAKPFLYASTGRRHRSSEASDKPIFILVDLDASSSSPSTASTSENEMGEAAMSMVDDLVKLSIANKIKPDWLPFRPGSSFWVPPIPSVTHLMPLVDKRKLLNTLTEAETFPDAKLRGWPCSAALLPEGDEESNDDVIVLEFKGVRDTEIEVKLARNPITSQFDDDDEG